MAKILVGGAGGAPSEGVIYSLKKSAANHTVVGIGSNPVDLVLSKADQVFSVPEANDPSYTGELLAVIAKEKPDFVHFQNDAEILVVSGLRNEIESLGPKTFMPNHKTVETCVSKHLSYLAFKKAGIVVPENELIETPVDLRKAFQDFGNGAGEIWLRSSEIGGGGQGSLSTSNFDFAKSWIDHHSGWGTFLASEHLLSESVTWLSIWDRGKLVVAQTRRRRGWIHGNRSVSGVTGVTQLGITDSDQTVDAVATASVFAVDEVPHGIYGVDMTYDKHNVPNPTEINIARFFTTIRFFTEAGLNMPEIYAHLALGIDVSRTKRTLNPLPDGLGWFRGMDREPQLLVMADFENAFRSK
jgi:carbamoyl-phosphate synthase large subunit